MTIAVLDTRSPGFAPAFERLERRRSATRTEVEGAVRAVVEDVRARGDAAIVDATERFDGYRPRPGDLCVSPEEIAAARDRLAPEDRDALALAAARIRAFHARQIPASWRARGAEELLGQEVRPISRVGVYVPAVQAPLASSVLMLAIPASVAGVPEIVMATPGREIHPAVLEAARLAEIDRVFRIGGAQAIAALAFGTETVPRVDKIVGPGSAYTQAAKRLVFGDVGIDSEAGPSEVFIVADTSASPEYVAADLLAQAEHEEHASVVLATPVAELIQETEAELARQLAHLPRREVATASLQNHGALLRTRDLEEAMALANRFAPEHLELLVRDPESWLSRVEHAGAVFLGPHSPVPMGDYLAGPSHVLPTGGTARFFSPIGVEDFQKRISVIGLEAGALSRLGPSVVRLATLEGLDAHARAVQCRLARAPSKAGP
jgi:histidinol dehydrogenase